MADQGATVTVRLQLLADGRHRLAAAGVPAAAVGEHDGRKSWVGGDVKIELAFVAALGVGDVAFDTRALGPESTGQSQNDKDGKSRRVHHYLRRLTMR